MKESAKPEALEPILSAEPSSSDIAAETPSQLTETPEEINRQREECYDLLLRKTAEFDNYRKRIDRERKEVAETASVDLVRELLSLVDDLERALGAEVSDNAVHSYRAGVELIHKQLLDVLRKRGVSQIETAGQDFDPHYHQAVAHEVSADHSEGAIIDEFRRGYVMYGRLLRPAMVRVAKA